MRDEHHLAELVDYCRRHARMLRRTAQTGRERARTAVEAMRILYLKDAACHEAGAARWEQWADGVERLMAGR